MERPEFIIPCYLLVDVSRSMMYPDDGMLREFVAAIVNELEHHPVHSEQIRFSLLQFADSLEVVLPLCEPSARLRIPGLALGRPTRLERALLAVRDRIIADVRLLQAEGYTVCRPSLFLASDSAFCDDWKHAHDELTDFDPLDGSGFPWYPRIVPVGIGADADGEALQELVHPPLLSRRLMVTDESDLAVSIAYIADSMLFSVLQPWQAPEVLNRSGAVHDDDFV